MLEKILTKLKNNLIATTSVTLLLACFNFYYVSENEIPESFEKINKDNLYQAEFNFELQQTENSYQIWNQTKEEIDCILNSFINNESQVKKGNVKKNFFLNCSTNSNSELLYKLNIYKKNINLINSLLKSSTIENKNLKKANQFIQLNTDILDTIISRNLKILQNEVTDTLDIKIIISKAYREYSLELSNSKNSIYNLINLEINKFNSLVKIDYLYRERYSFKSKLRILCFIYFGVFIGGWIGYFIYKNRTRKINKNVG